MAKQNRNIIILVFLISSIIGHAMNPKNNEFDLIIEGLVQEIRDINHLYEQKYDNINLSIKEVRQELKTANSNQSKIELLIKKNTLDEELAKVRQLNISDINKVKYLKGLEMIKILYDKTLALDHHFASVSTLNEINKIANPNTYKEFNTVKSSLEKQSSKKKGFNLSDILGENLYISVIHSFISLFTNERISKEEKENNLQKIECIIDFTLRIQNDLNTIYFETVYLQKSNDNIKSDIQRLFAEYTKPIKYRVSLETCRNEDDWDSIRELLEKYISTMDAAIKDEPESNKVRKLKVNLEFPIDRLLQYINQYNNFINQGSKFYEKFGIMLSSYKNEAQCSDQIPLEYEVLKQNITIAIEKFTTAYKPVEINGSKMKEILYGINEYE